VLSPAHGDERAVAPPDRAALVPVGAPRAPEQLSDVRVDVRDRRRRVEGL
jgi:hypothetical protein